VFCGTKISQIYGRWESSSFEGDDKKAVNFFEKKCTLAASVVTPCKSLATRLV